MESDGGHLVTPTRLSYGEREEIFDEYDSFEDAVAAIEANAKFYGGWSGSYFVIPTVSSYHERK